MKIICVALNYPSHNREVNDQSTVYYEPVVFMKSETSLLKGGKPFYIPDFSSDIQYEAEVVVRICLMGKNIASKFAYRYFDKITIGIDMTARDLQNKFREKGYPWELCKSFDYSAIIGTFICPKELNIDINHLPFQLNINNKLAQQGNTEKMLFNINEIIAYISRFITLKTGDLIFTGTPEGSGSIHINDRLEGYIEDKKLLDFYIK